LKTFAYDLNVRGQSLQAGFHVNSFGLDEDIQKNSKKRKMKHRLGITISKQGFPLTEDWKETLPCDEK